MTREQSSRDLGGDLLNTSLSRRTLLRTAVAAGTAAQMLGAPGAVLAAQDQTGKPGGTAVQAVNANPLSWDVSSATWPTWEALIHLYDRILTFDESEQLQPGLATAWEVSEDGLTYTLHLRDGVTFHDGTPFNADAIKFNIQRNIDLPDSTWYATYEPVDHVEVVDDLTAKIVLKEVRPNFAYEGFAQWGAAQVSPTAYQAQGADNYGNPPVGTGPFKFDSYEPGSEINYVRNDAYWGGAPLLDGVKIRVIPDPSVQKLEIEAKTVDSILVDPKDVGELKDKGATIDQRISPGTSFISLNSSKPPTSELAVRKAIARAIDRDTIIKTVLFGYAEKSQAGVTSDSPFFNADVPSVEYDPDEAGKILDEAGWVMGDGDIRQKDGQPLTVNIFSTDFAGWSLYNQIIQEQLKAIGIDSKISSLEWNAYLDQWRQNQGDWNVTYHQQGSIMAATSPIQASWVPDSYWSITQIDDATDPDLVKVRDQLQALGDQFEVELDQEKRKEIAKQAQTIFQDNQLAVWLWHAATIHAILPRLKDYQLTHAGRILELGKAWVE
ncbi:MAG TPA: ABC transporter substrate-binding protein [Thermomicrobiales bacterium]|jgi:peptide/nickel transport system substrate-binding protein